MHVVDDVHGVDIETGQPVPIGGHPGQDLVIVLGSPPRKPAPPVPPGCRTASILAAVEAHEQQLCQVGPGPEKNCIRFPSRMAETQQAMP